MVPADGIAMGVPGAITAARRWNVDTEVLAGAPQAIRPGVDHKEPASGCFAIGSAR